MAQGEALAMVPSSARTCVKYLPVMAKVCGDGSVPVTDMGRTLAPYSYMLGFFLKTHMEGSFDLGAEWRQYNPRALKRVQAFQLSRDELSQITTNFAAPGTHTYCMLLKNDTRAYYVVARSKKGERACDTVPAQECRASYRGVDAQRVPTAGRPQPVARPRV